MIPAIANARTMARDVLRHVHDDEVAHGREDELRAYCLTVIRDTPMSLEEARELATIAMSTDALDFYRWCA